MAVISSFQTKFDLTLTPKQVIFTDTTSWVAQGVALVDVVGNFSITSPSGIVVYNNTSISNAGCDIDIVTSLISQHSISLPLGSDGFPESGNYTILYRVWDSNLNIYYYKTNIVNYQYTQPTICITQNIDCLTPLFSSVDSTNYTVNGIVPVISGTQTLDYPYGSAGEGSPTIITYTAVASVIAVSTFYQGTQTTELVSALTYTFVSGVNGFIIYDSISGQREVKVDCSGLCSILCCLRTFYRTKESYRGNNEEKFTYYNNIYKEIMSDVMLMRVNIECGSGDEVCDLLKKVKLLSECSDSCNCDSITPSRVIGLGYLVGPAGPQGPPGVGSTGAQGTAGTNGINGTSVLYNSIVPASDTSGAVVQLQVYTIPAAALASTGDYLVVESSGSCIQTTSFSVIQFWINSVNVVPTPPGEFGLWSGTKYYTLRATLTRISNVAVSITFEVKYSGGTNFDHTGGTYLFLSTTTVNALATLTNTVHIAGGVFTPGDTITANNMTVTKYKI